MLAAQQMYHLRTSRSFQKHFHKGLGSCARGKHNKSVHSGNYCDLILTQRQGRPGETKTKILVTKKQKRKKNHRCSWWMEYKSYLTPLSTSLLLISNALFLEVHWGGWTALWWGRKHCPFCASAQQETVYPGVPSSPSIRHCHINVDKDFQVFL